MKILLNYAVLQTLEVKQYEFDQSEVLKFVQNATSINYTECVYLVCIEDEIIITENRNFVVELFENHFNSVYPYYGKKTIHIHEYYSFEDAYSVALDMREINPKCYS
jgi:hypothetical protein